ncbi:MAG TPA: hypothetical protein VN721_10085 [Flavipsychrobacter sp.]|nr:hypothetical protein [Flavipsychrobacter sp.]
MKNFRQLIWLVFFSCSISNVQAQPAPVQLNVLSGFFLSNKVTLDKGLNCMVVTKQKEFMKLFGIAKTATNTVTMPAFDKEQVLVLAMPETNKETTIKFDHATKAGTFIEVYCEVQKKNEPLTYTTLPIALAAIPKYNEVNTIKFYEGSSLVNEVKVKH